MNQRFLALVVLLAIGIAGAVALAVIGMPASQGRDGAAFDRKVRAYLMTNPEVIMEAVRALERRNEARRAAAARNAIVRHRARLEDPAPLPVLGNAQGDVTVVEFFDYRCPYCKQAVGELKAMMASDGNIRLVLKEFPVLGADSVLAARAALAANMQGKYAAFHDALMARDGVIDAAVVNEVAKAVGLDTARLAADMARPEIDAVIRESHALARDLGINGTPAFVIGDQLLPGYFDRQTMARAVAEARRTKGQRR